MDFDNESERLKDLEVRVTKLLERSVVLNEELVDTPENHHGKRYHLISELRSVVNECIEGSAELMHTFEQLKTEAPRYLRRDIQKCIDDARNQRLTFYVQYAALTEMMDQEGLETLRDISKLSVENSD